MSHRGTPLGPSSLSATPSSSSASTELLPNAAWLESPLPADSAAHSPSSGCASVAAGRSHQRTCLGVRHGTRSTAGEPRAVMPRLDAEWGPRHRMRGSLSRLVEQPDPDQVGDLRRPAERLDPEPSHTRTRSNPVEPSRTQSNPQWTRKYLERLWGAFGYTGPETHPLTREHRRLLAGLTSRSGPVSGPSSWPRLTRQLPRPPSCGIRLATHSLLVRGDPAMPLDQDYLRALK
jgi:hypothetical protein